jgi:FKBP-type peptidyl-prolyl cis-trans isomerase FkpA
MKYIFSILALAIVVEASAQTDLQRTLRGAYYQVFTHNTGDKIKLNDVITFQFIEKTDKDSVLYNSYVAGRPGQTQIVAPKNVGDLMEIFPLLTLNDSLFVKVPTDSIFAGNEAQRPSFLPKGSNLIFTLKIQKIQSLSDAIAERNAIRDKENAERTAATEKLKAAEAPAAAKYIADHKLVLKTTASGLKYVITKPSIKPKPQKGDTLLVNYAGRGLDDKVFDSSIESVAKEAGLNQPGRVYEPLQVIIGTSSIIAGWDEGLLLMNEGSKATFVIPSSLAYGAGYQDIKPYSTLVFDVELVKIKPIKHPVVSKPPVKKPLYKKKTPAKKN